MNRKEIQIKMVYVAGGQMKACAEIVLNTL